MKFEELNLLRAVSQVHRDQILPGKDYTDDEFRPMYYRVIDKLLDVYGPEYGPDTLSCVKQFWVQYRKRMPKSRLLVEIIEVHGGSCFYNGRNLGMCQGGATLDRLNAGGEYSLANCIIACEKHNSARGNKTIDEYLSTGRDDNGV